MGCKYCNYHGMCGMWDEDADEHIIKSCDDKGHCLVEEDEDPSISCEDYESDEY